MNILITGGNGQLGQEIRKFSGNRKKFVFTDAETLDVTKKEKILDFVNTNNISYIINCAAYTDVNKSELMQSEALNINSNGVKNIVEVCEKKNIKLIHISTDYVYDGNNLDPIK